MVTDAPNVEETMENEEEYIEFAQCYLCKKICEISVASTALTSDGEAICGKCCDWLWEERRKADEL